MLVERLQKVTNIRILTRLSKIGFEFAFFDSSFHNCTRTRTFSGREGELIAEYLGEL
jgi:hypothetical protein